MLYAKRLAATLTLSACLLTACASNPETASPPSATGGVNNDPFESVNRVVFDVNSFLDSLLLRPLAELYRVTIPPVLRDRLAGIVKNMTEPVIFANNLLQGETTSAKTTLGRFLVNTTVGVGGMFEVANDMDLQRQTGDFGQTLYAWGLPEGPYLVLPFFGPSNVRDAIGLGVDSLMSPWKYIAATGGSGVEDRFFIADTAASGLVRREENLDSMDALREGSLDFYAQLRSVYRQHRAKVLGQPLPTDMGGYDEEYDTTAEPAVH